MKNDKTDSTLTVAEIVGGNDGGLPTVPPETHILLRPPEALAQTKYIDFVYLLPTLGFPDYFGLRSNEPGQFSQPDQRSLFAEWFKAVELSNGRLPTPTNYPVSAVPASLHKRVEMLKQSGVFDHLAQIAPADVVYLDPAMMVVFQPHVDLDHVERLDDQLGVEPTEEAIFDFCLERDGRHPDVEVMRIGQHSFVLTSVSNDLRAMQSFVVEPNRLANYGGIGSLTQFIGIGAIYTDNLLRAVLWNGRPHLMNGTHRAYTLARRGVRQVPCVLQMPQNPAQAQAVLAPIYLNDQRYRMPRPLLIADYLDKDVIAIVKQHRKLRWLRVTISCEDGYVPVAV